MGKAIWIKEALCFGCRQAFRVAFGTIDRELLQPERFSDEERELAICAGANLGWVEIQAHKQMPELYPPTMLANRCPKCGDHKVDFRLQDLVRELQGDPAVLPIWRDSAGPVCTAPVH